MARTQKKGIDYFSCDVDFFSDKKIKILKSRYGPDGIVLYLYLLCEIYRNGYYLILDDDWEFIISDDLSMDSNKVKQVLNFLLERSLFDNTLFQSDKVLTSTRIQKNYQEAVKSRAVKTNIIVDNYWILKEEETATYIKVTHFQDNSEKNEDSSKKNKDNSEKNDTKESKEKKNKSKENKTKDVYFANQELNNAFCLYLACRKNNNDEVKGEQISLLIQEVVSLSSDVSEQIAIVNKATMGNWKSFYPLKSDKKIGRPKNARKFEERHYNHGELERLAEEARNRKYQKMKEEMEKEKQNEHK